MTGRESFTNKKTITLKEEWDSFNTNCLSQKGKACVGKKKKKKKKNHNKTSSTCLQFLRQLILIPKENEHANEPACLPS